MELRITLNSFAGVDKCRSSMGVNNGAQKS
jgi:hypothetical protein